MINSKWIIPSSLLLLLALLITVLQSPPHIALLITIMCLLSYGALQKKDWKSMEQGMIHGVSQSLSPIFMLVLIGILVSVWMMSGTIPTILYYGLHYLSPRWYYLSAITICIVTSSFTGSSIATVSTVGVALIGVAKGLSIPLAPAAGAIICGASFGDKCSPLSETTNLAPGVVGIELYEHVKALLVTTIPALSLTLLIFLCLGLKLTPHATEVTLALQEDLQTHFHLSWLTLLSPCFVFGLALFRIPALITFTGGIISGLLTCTFVQHNYKIKVWGEVMQNGFVLQKCSNKLLCDLVNRGGLQSMMWAISLVSIALAFGGLLQHLGFTNFTWQGGIKNNRYTEGRIGMAACLSSIAINFLTGEQYLSIVLPGKAFKGLFKQHQIPLKNLSRILEDCGTLVNPLVPWGVCATFYRAALGVSPGAYIPYTFFLYLSPLFSILIGFLPSVTCSPTKS